MKRQIFFLFFLIHHYWVTHFQPLSVASPADRSTFHHFDTLSMAGGFLHMSWRCPQCKTHIWIELFDSSSLLGSPVSRANLSRARLCISRSCICPAHNLSVYNLVYTMAHGTYFAKIHKCSLASPASFVSLKVTVRRSVKRAYWTSGGSDGVKSALPGLNGFPGVRGEWKQFACLSDDCSSSRPNPFACLSLTSRQSNFLFVYFGVLRRENYSRKSSTLL